MQYDTIIRNGTVINGHEEPVTADVGVSEDRILDIGSLSSDNADRVIDAEGMVVSPGFIDIHGHSDFALTLPEPDLAKLTQGITTEVTGNCGFSGAPYSENVLPFFDEYVFPILGKKGPQPHWYEWRGFLDVVRDNGTVCNIAPMVGQGNLRLLTVGLEDRPATSDEIAQMCDLLDSVMGQGCFGFSTGLIYPPGVYTPPEELVALAERATARGGFYSTHIRNEGDTVEEAIGEALNVARKTGIPLQISHLKCAGPDNWPKTGAILDMIQACSDDGFDVTFDAYPYPAASTSLTALLPPWMHEGGVTSLLNKLKDESARKLVKEQFKTGLAGWQNIVDFCGWEKIIISQVRSEKNRSWEGRTINEIAATENKSAEDCLFDMILAENAAIGMIMFMMSEDSVSQILAHPSGFMGTDGLPHRRPHPRTWGSFTRLFGKYVREEKLMSLPEAVYKCSTGPARKLGLDDRGGIHQGKAADVVIFDPETIADKATYRDPAQASEGIRYILVNGKIVIDPDGFNGAKNGRLLDKKA